MGRRYLGMEWQLVSIFIEVSLCDLCSFMYYKKTRHTHKHKGRIGNFELTLLRIVVICFCKCIFVFIFFCSRSSIWKRVNKETKEKLELRVENDGEFW